MTARPRQLLATCLLIIGATEVAMSFSIDQPVAAIAFAVPMLAAGAVLTRRMNVPAAVIGTLLMLIDGAGVPFYSKDNWRDWATQLAFAGVCLTGVIAFVITMRRHRATARTRNRQPRTVATSE